jgi:hypothetical protein
MSSLRPAKIATTLFHLIGGSLAEAQEPAGPPCSCERCQEAWSRNQSREKSAPGPRTESSFARVGPG